MSWWLTGGRKLEFGPFSSVGNVWKECQASGSAMCTSKGTWPGAQTESRHSRGFTSWGSPGRTNTSKNYLCPFTIESILTYWNGVWFSSCTVAEWKMLQIVITTSQKTIRCPLSSLQELCSPRCLKTAQSIQPQTPVWTAALRQGQRDLKNTLSKRNNFIYTARAVQLFNTMNYFIVSA